jgi:hypothetical protein
MPAKNCKSTNAITHLFSSKCRLPFGAWNISKCVLPELSELKETIDNPEKEELSKS